MALNVKQGIFNLKSTTGNQAVSGVGFTPKVVLLFCRAGTGDGGQATARIQIGAMDASGNQRAVTCRDQDAVADTDATRVWYSTRCLVLQENNTTTIEYAASYVSFDSDGFTIDVAVNGAGDSPQVGYLALGGDDISNATVGSFSIGTGASDAVSVGHDVTGLILFSALTNNASGSSSDDEEIAMGFSDGTRHSAIAISSQGAGEPTSDCNRCISSTHAMLRSVIGGGIGKNGESTVSFGTSGFTLTHDDAYSSSFNCMYVAINGPRFYVGNVNTPSSTGSFSVSGVGFTPSAILTLSSSTTSADGNEFTGNQLWFCVGASTGSGQSFAMGIEGEDNLGTTNANKFSNTSSVWVRNDHGTTVTATATTTSFDSDGFTLNKNLASNTQQNKIFYMAIAGKAGSWFLLQDRNNLYKSEMRGIN